MSKRTLNLLVLIFILSAVCVFSDDTIALHPYYEQNGDCYVLIGEGAHRAVWAMHNLEPGVREERLYDPYNAYGISASQRWAGSYSEKFLYTFASKETERFAIRSKQPRKMVVGASYAVYEMPEIPDKTVHRYHTKPDDSITHLGNHDKQTIDDNFGGVCYPCNVVPDAVATMPGYYWYPVGSGYYHDMTRPVWSRYTYVHHGHWPNDDPPTFYYEMFNPPPPEKRYVGSKVDIDVGPPVGHDYSFEWSEFFRWCRGGWVHRVVKENLEGSRINLALYQYRVGSGANEPDKKNDVASVWGKITGTMNMNGECCDGCITVVPNVALPAIPSPYVSCAYSSILNQSYVYTRGQDSNDYTLAGSSPNDVILGDGHDLTCKFVGVSSKDNQSNYVYLLGKNLINQWMSDSSCPAAMKLNELTSVAVSDQWWQTGGIVYAYDATKAKIYSFVRKENGKSDPPEEIDVDDNGVKPSAIGADGFGSLYLLKTHYEPKTTQGFVDGNEIEKRRNGFVYGTSKPMFIAKWEQKVFKKVYSRAYDTKVIKQENNGIYMGSNYFERPYTTEDGKIDSPKIFVGGFNQIGEVVDDNIRSELAVINSPTPPRPTNVKALIDCDGPMKLDNEAGFVAAEPTSDGHFTSDQELWFLVENAPYFDANGLNIGSVGQDTDHDGRIGRFPSTLSKEDTCFHWKIIRTHDREGNKVDETSPDNVILDSDGEYLLNFPSELEGSFKIGVRVTYRYYDYGRLTPGSLASDKASALYPKKTDENGNYVEPIVGAGEGSDGYSWQTISMTKVPRLLEAQDKGIVMTGTDANDLSTYKPGGNKYGCENGCTHAICKGSEQNPETTRFVLDGASLVKSVKIDAGGYAAADYEGNAINWGMALRETQYNLKRGIDRIASMTSEEPPVPNDPRLVEGTLRWAGELMATWRSELKIGENIIFSEQVVTPSPSLTLNELRKLLPMPCEPLSYKISVDMSRKYMYEYYSPIPRYVGGVFTGSYSYSRIPKSVSLNIWGEAEVIVTDNTKPALFVYNALHKSDTDKIFSGYGLKQRLLKATTGEPLAKYNGDVIEFYTADNNPAANYADTAFAQRQDAYHYSELPPYNRLKTSFSPSNQQGIFTYDRIDRSLSQDGNYTISKTEVPSDESVKPAYTANRANAQLKLLTEADKQELEDVGMQYSKALSYQKYTFKISDIKHCGRDKNGVWSPDMPMCYANNTEGYVNPSYGLCWVEACGLGIAPQKIGQIVIKDNDRPNVFLDAVYDKYPEDVFYAPSGFEKASMEKWVQTNISEDNGPEIWAEAEGGVLSCFNAPNMPLNSSLRLFTKDKALETDVPVTFGTLVSDNSGSCTVKVYKLGSGSSGESCLYNALDNVNQPMQYEFRAPGTYSVLIEVEDDALDWPSNPNKPAEAAKSPNKRVLKAVFGVVDTKLEYYVIEEKINEAPLSQ